MGNIDKRLIELGIILPDFKIGSEHSLILVQKTNNLIFTSGHDCRSKDELIYKGKLGDDLTIDQGYDAAYQCMINILSSLRNKIEDLDKINRIVKVLGFVNSAPGFAEQPYVLNGASELLENIFGEKGKHARSAIGVNELPYNTPVEIEMIVEINN